MPYSLSMPESDKEQTRQASLPLNSFDLELGTSDIEGKLQATEASDAGTPPVEPAAADRQHAQQVKRGFRSAACAIVSCNHVHQNVPKQSRGVDLRKAERSRGRLVMPLIVLAVLARCDTCSELTFADGKVLA